MSYKILVVDDEADVRDILERKLLREGYEVICAKDGEEAIALVASDNPDIILLDLMLPKCNGFDVLKQVREKFNDKWRPVIIVSGQQDLDSVKKCYQLEADHYLAKPCGIEHVLDGIKTMISLIPLRQK
jgi:two-component system, OmpR family, response regulator VicR